MNPEQCISRRKNQMLPRRGGETFSPPPALPSILPGAEGMNNKCTASSLFQPNICRLRIHSIPLRVSTTALDLLEDPPTRTWFRCWDWWYHTCQENEKSCITHSRPPSSSKMTWAKGRGASGFGLHCGWREGQGEQWPSMHSLNFLPALRERASPFSCWLSQRWDTRGMKEGWG